MVSHVETKTIWLIWNHLVGAVGNCQKLLKMISVCFSFASTSTSYLFYLRISAVFSRDQRIVWTFGLLLLGQLICTISGPFLLSGVHIGPTSRCIETSTNSYGSSGIIASIAYDTLVFICISWRLVNNTFSDGGIREKLRKVVSGSSLPTLSKVLLKGGQLYYV